MIILQADLSKIESKSKQNKTTFRTKIKAFQGLFETILYKLYKQSLPVQTSFI